MELRMSDKERDRLEVMRRLRRGQIQQVDAAQMMRLSTRQVRRIQRRVEREGDLGLVHRARGRPSNRRTPPETERRAKALLRQRYHDFGPTLAMEHLAEDDGIVLSCETVRKFMHEEHLWAQQRKPRPHRRRRERRAAFGELVQIDTSDHDWFEGRADKCALIDMIDDATGRRLLRLFPADTAVANFEMIRRWIEAFGRPRDLYADAAGHFRPPQQRGKRPSLSQIERALQTLSIGLIVARSPQAKGRVERAHGVDQDRLIKQMRLRGISTIAGGNRFLDEVYLPRMNGRFAVKPRHRRDAHRSARRFDLDAILCPHQTRRVANDHTVRIDSTLWQIEPNGRSLAGATVTVERRLDGTMRLRHGERDLTFRRADRQRP
jgi:transposase